MEEENKSLGQLETMYSNEASSTNAADDILSEYGLVEEETGLPQPIEPTVEIQEESTVGQIVDFAGDVVEGAKSVASDPEKVKNVVAGAVVDTTQELGNFAIDTANYFEDWLKESGVTTKDIVPDDFRLDYADKLVPQAPDLATQTTRKIAGYLLPFAGYMKLFKGAKYLNNVSRTFVSGAATGFTAIDPTEKNLSNLIQEQTDLMDPVVGMLAIDEEDSMIEARAKNAIESLIVDTTLLGTGLVAGKVAKGTVKQTSKLTEAFTHHLKAVKRARRMKKSKTVIDETREAIKKEFDAATKEKPIKPQEPTVKDVLPESRIKMDTLADTPDMVKYMKNYMANNRKSLEASMRGLSSDTKVAKKAVEILQDPKQVDDLLKRTSDIREAGGSLGDVDTVAVNSMFKLVAKAADDLARTAQKSGLISDKAQALRAMNSMKRWGDIVLGNKSQQGRGLRAQQSSAAISKITPKDKYLAEVINIHGGIKNADEMIDLFVKNLDVPESDFVEAAGKVARKSGFKKTMDALHEVRVNGLVSSFRTVGLAVGNGAVRVPLEIAERGLASVFTRGAKAGKRVYAREALEQMRGAISESGNQALVLMGGLIDMFKLSRHGLLEQQIKAARTSQAKLPQLLDILSENKVSRTITAESFGYTGTIGRAIDVAGSIISAPTSLLQRADRAIGAIHYRMEVRALAARTGLDSGLNGKELSDFIEMMAKNPPDALPAKIQDIGEVVADKAIGQANRVRFLNKLEGGFKAAETALHAPGIRMFAPFARIDLNILSQSMERIPGLNRFAPEYKRALANGGADLALAEARVAIGSAFMGSVGLMVFNGQITGKGPADYEQRRLLESMGWQPYSIKIGDEYVRWDRFADPMTRVMKLAADMSEIAGYVYGDLKDENASQNFKDLAAVTVGTIASAASPDFLAGGIGDLAMFIENPERGFDQTLRQVVVGQVPFSSLLRSIRQEVDPMKRQTKSFDESMYGMLNQQLNEIRNIIPGFSSDLPAQTNIFGDVVHYPTGFGPDMMSPIYVTEHKEDIVITEMISLGSAGPLIHPKAKLGEEHLVIKMPPKTIDASVAGVSQPVRLTPKQYHDYVMLAAGYGLEGFDLTLKEQLEQTITNGYPELDGMNKTDQAKRIVISSYVEAYRSAAKAQLLEQDEGIMKQLEQNFMDIERAITGEEE
jgi:hypothetical protein